MDIWQDPKIHGRRGNRAPAIRAIARPQASLGGLIHFLTKKLPVDKRLSGVVAYNQIIQPINGL
jgi:hypothetical protein